MSARNARKTTSSYLSDFTGGREVTRWQKLSAVFAKEQEECSAQTVMAKELFGMATRSAYAPIAITEKNHASTAAEKEKNMIACSDAFA